MLYSRPLARSRQWWCIDDLWLDLELFGASLPRLDFDILTRGQDNDITTTPGTHNGMGTLKL